MGRLQACKDDPCMIASSVLALPLLAYSRCGLRYLLDLKIQSAHREQETQNELPVKGMNANDDLSSALADLCS